MMAPDTLLARMCEDTPHFCLLMMKLYGYIMNLLFPPFSDLLNWIYLVSSLLLALMIYFNKLSPTARASPTDFISWCLPARIYLHKSATVDYRWYFINGWLSQFIEWALLVVSAAAVGEVVLSVLGSLLGEFQHKLEPSWLSRSVYTLLVIVVFDLGFFLAHYLEHNVPLFWEFHKVHHSAEVLTPVTAYRFHPMDTLIQGCIISAVVGMVEGGFQYLFRYKIGIIDIFGLSVIWVAFNLIANLRHSHIWLSYGWRLSHVLSSPAQHQIHHSAETRHLGKNLGLIFSFWDWVAGTLYVPRKHEQFKLGLINEEHKEFSSVWACYVLPIRKAMAHATVSLIHKGRPVFRA